MTLTTSQVAARAGCDQRTVLRAIAAGRIDAVKAPYQRADGPDRRWAGPRMSWQIVPASGLRWAASYTAWEGTGRYERHPR